MMELSTATGHEFKHLNQADKLVECIKSEEENEMWSAEIIEHIMVSAQQHYQKKLMPLVKKVIGFKSEETLIDTDYNSFRVFETRMTISVSSYYEHDTTDLRWDKLISYNDDGVLGVDGEYLTKDEFSQRLSQDKELKSFFDKHFLPNATGSHYTAYLWAAKLVKLSNRTVWVHPENTDSSIPEPDEYVANGN